MDYIEPLDVVENHSLATDYDLQASIAEVLVRNRKASLIRKREIYDDLLRQMEEIDS